MATINNKLIHFKSKSNFNDRYAESTDGGKTYGDFLGTSIVFIQDAKQIWTHGQFYDANEATLASLGITATAAELNYMDGVTSNVQTQLNEIKESVDSISDPYEINLTNLLSAEDSESISTAIGGIDNLNATVQDNRIIVGTISNGSVSVSIRILGNVTTLYYLLDTVLGLTLNEVVITNTSGTLSKSVTTHSVLTENMVINSLNSDETTLPLSAAQGKALNSKINGNAPYIIDGNILLKDSPTSEEIDTAIGGWDNLVAAIQNQRTVILLEQYIWVYASFLGYHDESKEIAIDFVSIDTNNSDAVTTRNMCLFLNNVDGTISLKYIENSTLSQNYEYLVLDTTDKTVLGAINELKSNIGNGVGKIDPNSNGTGEIFNHYSDYPNKATGICSHAESYRTTASGNYSHAEGYFTKASGRDSHAEGRYTIASGNASHAEGSNTEALGLYSHAEGLSSIAWKTTSHVEGSFTQAFEADEHAEGTYNKSYDSDSTSVRVVHSVGIGSSDTDRKNAHEIKFNGDHYIYGLGNFDGTNSKDAQTLQEVINSKQATITAGTGLEFEGTTLNVTLDTTVFKVVSALPDSPAQGDENKIHLVPAESTGANNAYTEYVWVNSAWEILGEYTSEVDLTPYLKTADAASTYLNKTDAVGKVDPDSPDGTGEIFNCYEGSNKNIASGNYSHAEGSNAKAYGIYSHAEGFNTISRGDYSHTEGHHAVADGDCSHAEGYNTTAAGRSSHTEGENTYAWSAGSHAEGGNTVANNAYEHAEGSYNLSNESTTSRLRTHHSVGIGSTPSRRRNAHEIMFNGDHYIYGLGGYDGTNATADTTQTLQEVINELLAKVQELESKNTELESRLAALEGTN